MVSHNKRHLRNIVIADCSVRSRNKSSLLAALHPIRADSRTFYTTRVSLWHLQDSAFSVALTRSYDTVGKLISAATFRQSSDPLDAVEIAATLISSKFSVFRAISLFGRGRFYSTRLSMLFCSLSSWLACNRASISFVHE